MVFSSLLFLFAFLPLTFLFYYAVPKSKLKLRNLVLFVMSLIFYGCGEPVYILLMIASICVAFFFGFPIAKYRESNKKRARLFMIVSICLNFSALVFFKYTNFILGNLRLIPFLTDKISLIAGLTLPIGISFYTFQIVSYTIDLYRGQTEVQRNFVAFGAYVTLFPQLIAGPIVRYRDVDDQLLDRTQTADLFGSGVLRFVRGIIKKIIIGDALAAVYEYCKAAADFQNTVVGAWLLVGCFTLHIYYDFSGYSDMAIGLGRMFGFRFLENFDYPYISASITEFWRRWHMSLGTWFKEYVYIPLGGNRVSPWKRYRNLFIVWALTGLWHGSNWNYVVWGLYFGVILALEKAFLLKRLEKLPRWISHVYAMLLVGIGWIWFSFTDMGAGIACLGTMFGIGADAFCTPTIGYTLLRSLPLLLIASVCATPYPKKLWDKLAQYDWIAPGSILPDGSEYGLVAKLTTPTARQKIVGWITFALAMLGFLLCIAYLVDSTYSPFLYFIF